MGLVPKGYCAANLRVCVAGHIGHVAPGWRSSVSLRKEAIEIATFSDR